MMTAKEASDMANLFKNTHSEIEWNKDEAKRVKARKRQERLTAKLLLKAEKVINKAAKCGKTRAYIGFWWGEDKRYLCWKALRGLGYDVDRNRQPFMLVEW
jgi:hypothetical protein